jgi:outer membrane protein TolC
MKFQAKKFPILINSNIYKFIILLFLALSPLKTVFAQDFHDFLRQIAISNSKIQASFYNLKAMTDGKMSTVGEYLPQAKLHYNYQIQDIQNVTGNIEDNYETNEYNLNISQKVLVPEIRPLLSKTKLKIEYAKLEYLKTKSSVFKDVIDNLVNIEALTQQLLFQENNKDLNANLYKVAEIKSKSGLINEIDLLQSKTEFLKAKSDFINVAKQLSIAKAKFEKLTGSNFIIEFNLLQYIQNFDFNLNQTIESAIENNFDALLAQNTLNQYKQEKKIQFADHLPSADFYYNHQKTRGRYSYYTNDDEENDFITYGINVTVPIFSSFKNTSDVIASSNLVIAKEQELYEITKTIKEEVTSIWEELNVNLALKKEHESYVEFAEKSYQAVKSQYESRLKDITYLLDAQNTLLDAKSKLNKTNAELVKNYFAIIFLTGKLDENIFNY